MKIITCTQGEPDWYAARRGIPTASEFDKIVTPAKGEYSTQARPYMFRLLAEKLLGETMQDIGNLPAVERGKMLEPQAIRAYEFDKAVETFAVGFVTTDDGRMGASPDRLLKGVSGAVEIKCPLAPTQIGYWFDGFKDDYKCQRQGQMLVIELEYVDLFSYHPQLPPAERRYVRDEPFIIKMRAALDQFCDEKDALEARLRATGLFDQQPFDADEDWSEYLGRLEKQAGLLDAG